MDSNHLMDVLYAGNGEGRNDDSFAGNYLMAGSTIEDGIIMSRNYTENLIPEKFGAAKVNGNKNNKGQNLWDGTYNVSLRRGLTLSKVFASVDVGMGYHDQAVLPIGSQVQVVWLNFNNVRIAVLSQGNSTEYYMKQLTGSAHLIDFGERIIRSGMCTTPELTSSGLGINPFEDNQFDNPNVAHEDGKVSDQNIDKVIKHPGGELFLDKFGRLLNLSRHPEHEFLITQGKIDSGQDDVSTLTTVQTQDDYYALIEDDESEPANLAEPFAPKKLNLKQYLQTPKQFKVEGDPDPDHRVPMGILPRFDKWIFKPIIIRKYATDADGEPEEGEIYSVHQQRSQSNPTGNVYGYVNTVTQLGDIKEFIPRHKNQRIVGDCLQSIGGNYDMRIKTTAMNADGSDNLNNLVHREYLADGTTRLRVNETAPDKATFDQTISPDGTIETYIKEGGGSSSDYNIKVVYSPDGTIELDVKDISITASGNTVVNGNVEITGGTCKIGGTVAPTGSGALCALKACLFSSAPHVGDTASGT